MAFIMCKQREVPHVCSGMTEKMDTIRLARPEIGTALSHKQSTSRLLEKTE